MPSAPAVTHKSDPRAAWDLNAWSKSPKTSPNARARCRRRSSPKDNVGAGRRYCSLIGWRASPNHLPTVDHNRVVHPLEPALVRLGERPPARAS
eukprot:1559366-Prymnesium_polylepis.1